MSLKLGSRIFAPRLFTTGITVLVLLLLLSLGRWQLRRADEKRALFDEFAQGSAATRRIDAMTPPLVRYQHVEAQGTYDSTRQILIDNMFDANGHAGYYVITPFALGNGGWLLVNRGWVPLGASRAQLPAIAVPEEVRTLRGRADQLPSAGIQMGLRAALHPPYPIVADFPAYDELKALLDGNPWAVATQVVLLDSDQTDGYERRWQAPGFPPLRNIAYAAQWFGLALALVIIYGVTNLRRDPAGKLPQ